MIVLSFPKEVSHSLLKLADQFWASPLSENGEQARGVWSCWESSLFDDIILQVGSTTEDFSSHKKDWWQSKDWLFVNFSSVFVSLKTADQRRRVLRVIWTTSSTEFAQLTAHPVKCHFHPYHEEEQ